MGKIYWLLFISTVDNDLKPQLVEESMGESKLMESIEVDFTAQGWLIIDISPAVKAWQLDHHTTKGAVFSENNQYSILNNQSPFNPN